MDLSFLKADDIVFDFGGYEGTWAEHAYNHNGPTVHIFEPHPTFAKGIQDRFSDNSSLITHAFALGTTDSTLLLSDDADASSAVAQKDNTITGEVKKASTFLEQIAPPAALAKINIEGGEYDLMPAFDQADWVKNINVFQIQFHLYSEADIAKRDAIRRTLSKTHNCDWEYPFVWEQWSLK
jgi:FkbM family methyltransferase